MKSNVLARVRPGWVVAILVIVSVTTTVLAMRRNSTTFDEIAPIAVGARGWHTGDWSMMTRFPPVMQYLYGIPGVLSHPNYPREGMTRNHYEYAREFLWKSGNDPEALVFRARLIAALFVGLLIVVTYGFASAYFGSGVGLLAASVVAFLPDVLAHGGVAYNDVPIAVAFMAALWAIDHAVRQPTLRNGVVAGLLASLALAIKHSALALGPIAIALVVMELLTRPDRRAWLRQIASVVGVAVIAAYLLQVLLYRGDFALALLRDSTGGLASHVSGGHSAANPSAIFHEKPGWEFYPLTFFLKTPLAFHLLMVLGIIGGVRTLRRERIHNLLLSRARAPLVACIIFGLIVSAARLVIGFRYVLPMLPLLAVLAAAGCMALWQQRRELRVAIVALVIWSAASTLSFYPDFLAYSSEYPPDREHAYRVLGDSSLDWGQGLIQLRDFMRENHIDQVYLGYFGSAIPEGYGINYVALPSFLPLTQKPLPAQHPRFAVVSATLLAGQYVNRDYYGNLHQARPYKILAHTLYVFEADD